MFLNYRSTILAQRPRQHIVVAILGEKKKIQQAPVNSRGAEPNECGKWDVCMFINYLLSFKKSTYLFLNPRHFPESIFFLHKKQQQQKQLQ